MMSPPWLRARFLIEAAVGAVVLAFAARVVWGWIGPSSTRLGYPYELEWMEGGILGHVARVLEGKTVYPPPSPDFVPFIYTPLYYYVSAPLVAVLGYGLFPLRLVSFLGTCTTVLLVARLIWLETRSILFGVAAGALYLGTCSVNGEWFDVARIDSLAVAIAMGSATLVRTARTPAGLLAGGVSTALGFFCKQSMLCIAPALLLWAFLRLRMRGALSYGLSLVSVLAVGSLLLSLTSDGWYWYYVFELPAGHGGLGRETVMQDYWRFELPTRIPIAFGCATLYLLGYPIGQSRSQFGFYIPLGLGLVLASYASRLHMGSYSNDLMPAHVAIALFTGLLLAAWTRPSLAGAPGACQRRVASCLAAAAQLWIVVRNPVPILPTQVDLDAGRSVVNLIRSTPGDVLVVNHPHLAVLAGKREHAHQMGMIDIYSGRALDPRGVRSTLRGAWSERFGQKSFSLVILDDHWYVFDNELRQHYMQTGDLGLSPEALWPKSGTRFRPNLVFKPKP
jgi:hypothetical protein